MSTENRASYTDTKYHVQLVDITDPAVKDLKRT